MVPSSIRQFRAVYESQFLAWCNQENYRLIAEIDLAALRAFRNTWEDQSSRTRHTKQIRMKQFFRFCVANGWIKENPAMGLTRIKVAQSQTNYFRPKEMEKLLNAALASDARNDHRGGKRLHALILLMRWSGLRITDAVTLERSRVINGQLMLYQMKTGTPVRVPLPSKVLEALENVPPGMASHPDYYFWSGNGKKETAADVFHKAFRRLASKHFAGKRAHPHMLRDTFAVELLLAGVPLDQVSKLLGHSNVSMTEKHYAPWVEARMTQLENSVRASWSA
ncbi:tyrosine-type recombinase/integrase [Silvibacterium acidisoli]|uniref:tyrosine-type recombinase/integrase n=1 Tax=Acidobacteriaceae bacterium ZG23-2 TaxID=2883246 RepID=UPI00406C501E